MTDLLLLSLSLLLLGASSRAQNCPANVTELNLEGEAAQRPLKKNFFSSCPKLRGLVVFDLSVDILRSNYLNGLKKLRSLEFVEAVKLRSLGPGFLRPARRLESLSFKRSGLRAIDRGALEPCARLENLHVEGCPIALIAPKALLRCGPTLKSLEFRSGQLRTLSPGALAGLSVLTSLSLERNSLSQLPEGAFKDLIDLRQLRLGHNDITSIHPHAFRGLTALEKLVLSNNRLSQLEGKRFASLSALRTLSLAQNKLSWVHGDAFSGLTGLTELDLSGNRLTVLPDAAIGQTSFLVHLDVSANRLTAVPSKSLLPRSLRSLRLAGNRLTCRPKLAKVRLVGVEKLSPCAEAAQLVASVTTAESNSQRPQRLALVKTSPATGQRKKGSGHVTAPGWLVAWAIGMTVAFAVASCALLFVLISCLRHRRRVRRYRQHPTSVPLTREETT